MLNRYKSISINTLIAEATVLKKRGYYAAAKHLVKQRLEQHPCNTELNALYQRIVMLQQVKTHRRSSTNQKQIAEQNGKLVV